MSKRFAPSQICLALLFLAVQPALAQTTPDPAFQFFEEEAETLYAAAKHKQTPASAPAAVLIVTAQEIEDHGYRTLAEILQNTADFYTVSDRNYSYVWVRGFGRPGDYNSRVLTLINGHRFNENIFGSTGFGHDFQLDVSWIKQIEIVKGPGSALHGDNAFFAVINIVTKSAEDVAPVEVGVEAGSYGTVKGRLTVSKKTSDGGLVAGIAGRSMKGQDLTYAEFSDINGGVAENSDGEKDYDVFANYRKGGFLLHAAHGDNKKEIPTGAFGETFNHQPPSSSSDPRSYIEAKQDLSLSSHLTVMARTYLDHYYYYGTYYYDPAYVEIVRNMWWGEEVSMRFAPTSRFAVTLGQDAEDSLKAEYEAYVKGIDEVDRFKDNSDRYSFYTQAEFQPVQPLQLTLGARYDHYQTFDAQISPRFVAILAVRKQSSIKAVYGTAFRAPSPYERLYTSLTAKDNPDLKPEEIETFETHWIETLAPQTSISVGCYQNRITHLIDQVIDPNDGFFVFQNSENVRARGIEVFSNWALSEKTNGRFGYTLQNTKQNDGRRLSNSPQHTGVFSFTRAIGSSLKASYDLLYIGLRQTNQQTTLPANTISNINLSWTVRNGSLRYYIGAYNAFNENFHQTGGAEHVQASIKQDGRNFLGGVDYRFGRPSKS